MKQFLIRLLTTVIGLFLYALGIVVTIKANIGYAPWDVFHVGLSNTIHLSLGTISILVGLVIVVIVAVLGEKTGLGTILNMILIGAFIDLIMGFDIIPTANGYLIGIPMLIAGLFIISVGTYFYIKSAFGAGPRDSLMVVMTRKTKLPVGVCRGIIELTVALAGWALGGMVGVGTIISVFGISFCVQITFKLFKFDPTAVTHETLDYTFAALLGKNKDNQRNE